MKLSTVLLHGRQSGKNCGIDQAVHQERLKKAMPNGNKAQQRRNGVYAYPGEKFEVEGVEFTITRVVQQLLYEMTDIDAQTVGFETLEPYNSVILKMHPGMSWINDGVAWVHTFQRSG